MKVLYVTGSCLTNNTSANMSHNGYIQGLLDNQCEVDIIMADSSWGEHDNMLHRWSSANYHVYKSENLIGYIRKIRVKRKGNKTNQNTHETRSNSDQVSLSYITKSKIKTTIKSMIKTHPIYPLEMTWLKHARSFQNKSKYDLIISNSSPAASHKLVADLLKDKRISADCWIQIWEDPWSQDIYSGFSQQIFDEERFLVSLADKVYYVSPLTLKYQKELFPESSSKMHHIPLPFYSTDIKDTDEERIIDFGYFGDYFSNTRDLLPFFSAVSSSNFSAAIFGDSDLNLCGNENVKVSGRVTLDCLSKTQNATRILVQLCNLSGGQIPGKIYHYSATYKPILFILDGTDEEQKMIFEYFNSFDRYYFVRNEAQEISRALKDMAENYIDKKYDPVEEFRPVNVVKSILNEITNYRA